jgi:transposase
VSDGMASVALDAAQSAVRGPVLGVAPGAIVGGFDVHRRQITFDAVDTVTGEVWRGQIASEPGGVEGWVARFPGRVVHVAVEACTGWLFVCQARAVGGGGASG